jgi:hypothetical protein
MTTPANRFVVGPDPQGRSAVLQRGLTNVQSRERLYWSATLWATEETPVDSTITGDRSQTPSRGESRQPLRQSLGRSIGPGRSKSSRNRWAARPIGLLAMIRANGPIRPWIIAGLLADSGDITGIAGAWRHMPTAKRWLGLGMASAAAAVGATVLATSPRDR